MVYERALRSRPQLDDELQGLEVDAGVRASGTYSGRKVFVFITKNSADYSVWVRGRSARGPGEFKQFHDLRPLLRFLDGVLDEPLDAYIY